MVTPGPGPGSRFVPWLTRLLKTQIKAECFSGWHGSILVMIMWVLWVPWGRDCGFLYVLSCSKIVAGILWTKANKSKPVYSHAFQNLLHFWNEKTTYSSLQALSNYSSPSHLDSSSFSTHLILTQLLSVTGSWSNYTLEVEILKSYSSNVEWYA